VWVAERQRPDPRTILARPHATATARAHDGMIDSLFIISSLGEVIIEKHYTHSTPRSLVSDLFWDLRKGPSPSEPSPILALDASRFAVFIKRGDLTFLAALTRDDPPLMVIELLSRVADVLAEYLGPPDEVKIKDNFSTVYQLLDEMLDGGFALVTEPYALKKMIAQPSIAGKLAQVVMGASATNISPKLPSSVVSSVPWRDKDTKYAQNEIYLDVDEELDCLMAADGKMLSCDIRGVINVTSRLSGMPDVIVTFEDASLLGDCAFHPSVRVSRWERERELCFTPPDGTFELLRYRVAKGAVAAFDNPVVPIYCTPHLTVGGESDEQGCLTGRVEILVGSRPLTERVNVDDVCVKLPLPAAAKFFDAKVTYGKVTFVDRTCTWRIGTLTPTQSAVRLTGTFSLPNDASVSSAVTAHLEFAFVAKPQSGLKVASLEIANQQYRFFKGVRTLVRAGTFQIRA